MLKLPARNQSAANPSGPAPSLAPIPEAGLHPSPVVEPVSAEALQAPAPVHQAATVPRPLALRAPLAPREAPVWRTPPPKSYCRREENPIVAESHSFASVIEPWHRTHNPSAALALLDAHERRYPNGHMRPETRVLRAEIYLAQGRESEALAVLDSVLWRACPAAASYKSCAANFASKRAVAPRASGILATYSERASPMRWPGELCVPFITVPETFSQLPSLENSRN